MPPTRPTADADVIDPREIITPDSFTVAPELIGLPLARPLRRAAAMLVDLVPLALLVNANAVFFAMAAAVLLWRASRGSPDPDAERPRFWQRRLLRVPAAIFAFVVVLRIIDGAGERLSRPTPPPTPAAAAAPAADAADGNNPDRQAPEPGQAEREPDRRPPEPDHDDDTDRGRRGRDDEESGRGALLGFLGGIAEDLGIGFGWTALYFTAFLALGNGQTPGKRMVGIQVIRLDGKPISWWIAFERFGGYAASIWTGLLGFLQIFWDRNRQGIHDKIAETVVVRVHGARYTPRR